MSWDWDARKVKRSIIDLIPLIICLCVLVSFFTSNWFKDWLGNLTDTGKALVLGSTLAMILFERYRTFKNIRRFY